MKTWEEMTEREQLLSVIGDAHKDAYGFRPIGGRYSDMTIEQLRDELDRLGDAVAESIADECRGLIHRQRLLEECISRTMENASVDRDTAIRWIFEAEKAYGADEFCWRMGISFQLAETYVTWRK